MPDIFAKHKIGHLSASTINQWIQQPALCLLKLGGFSDGEAGSSAWRGSGVDKALTKAALTRRSAAACGTPSMMAWLTTSTAS